MTDPFTPVERAGDRYVLRIAKDERQIVARMLGELGELIGDDAESLDPELTRRLFPVVYTNDPDHEAEYQRLMRGELLASKRAAIATVRHVLGGRGRSVTVTEPELLAFMQSTNSVRLVLGTMLGLTGDDSEDELALQPETPEHALYLFLSWVLDVAVHALSGPPTADGDTT